MRRVSSAALLANANVPTEANKSCEDISDIDLNEVPARLEATMKPSSNECSSGVSLFNLNLEEFMVDSTMVDSVQIHKERAEKEQERWMKLVSDVLKLTKENATKEYHFEPREEQQRYLKECPNLQNYLRGTLAFVNRGLRYIEYQRDLFNVQTEIVEHVRFQLNSQVNNAMHQNLAGKREP